MHRLSLGRLLPNGLVEPLPVKTVLEPVSAEAHIGDTRSQLVRRVLLPHRSEHALSPLSTALVPHQST